MWKKKPNSIDELTQKKRLWHPPNKKQKRKERIKSKKWFKMASPGLEPETFSVLDWRDNQLHHDTFVGGFIHIILYI